MATATTILGEKQTFKKEGILRLLKAKIHSDPTIKNSSGK